MLIPDHSQKLLSLLPGERKIALNIGSLVPEDIFKKLSSLTDNFDTIVLLNGDVWRYFEIENDIFCFPGFENKNVFLSNLGYTSEIRGFNKWKISWPFFYFNRTLKNQFDLKDTNLKYGYSCLNLRPALHRVILGYKLYKKDLLKDVILTQHWDDTVNKFYTDNLAELEQFDDFDKYKNLFPIVWGESDIPGNLSISSEMNHPAAYTQAYCNIVTESEICELPFGRDINLPIITEKSYKPFIAKQIPIFLAAKGHIKYLKSLGFECMESILPDGYDQFSALEKIDAIVNLIGQGTEYIRNFYFSHIREIEHNARLIHSTQVDELILQQIKDIL